MSLPLRCVAFALIPLQAITILPLPLSAVDLPSSASGSTAKPHERSHPVPVNRTVPKVSAPAKSTFSDPARDSEFFNSHVFAEPLIPIGNHTTPQENRELAEAVEAFREAANPEATEVLSDYLARFPDSPWRASLLANLGELYRSTGYWSKALNSWEDAWKLTSDQTDPRSKAVADDVLGSLAQMNARLGRVDRLESLFEQIGDRDVNGPAAETLAGARQGLTLMKSRPQDAFRCGPMALEKILSSTQPGSHLNKEIFESRSTTRGMSLDQVNQLANKLGMKYQMARRSPGAEVVIPSVVHWKVGHFAALTKEADKKFLSQDPTFTDDSWVSATALDEESSGYYLIPAGKMPRGWKPVGAKEAKSIWGRGNANANSKPTPPDVTPKVKDCAENHGMAGYNVDAARISLMIDDTPMSYVPPTGPAVSFSVSYSQREIAPVQVPTYSNLGNLWSFDWLSYIIIDPANGAADAAAYGPNGGSLDFGGFNSTTQSYAPQLQSRINLVKVAPDQYEERLPDGSKRIYSLSDGAPAYPRHIFMTQSLDAQGNALTYTYDSSFRLIAVTDALGQVTTLTYGLSADPLKITKVTDPFGRFTSIDYNASNQLWKITDTAGIVSQFTYGTSDFVKALTTPYGTTSFVIGSPSDTYRWIEVTDPEGAKERVEFNYYVASLPFSDPANLVPAVANPFNQYLNSRNTFFWDKKAMAEVPGDYTKARITHWLHTSDINVASDVPESTKGPLENRVWMSYPGGNGLQTGTSNKPSQIGRVLDDGSTQLYQYEYNDYGNVTKATDPVGRSTSYVYDTNGVDLLEVHQTTGEMDDLLAKYVYNSQHLPLTATDASGQATTYAYYPSGQIHTATNAKSEITTYGYDANGYLQSVTGALPGATAGFTYDGYGRVRTATDSEGYAVTIDYDAIGGNPATTLNRVAKISYPDGTYEQVTYNRLDSEWTRDRLGRWTQKFYDSLRRLVAVEDPLYRLTQYEWCGCGALEAIVDPNNNRTSWSRDIQGRVIDKVYPDANHIHYTYEAATSRLASTLDAKNQAVNYHYFVDNAVEQVSYTNALISTPSVSYTYDPNYSRLATMTDGTGLTTYAFNPIAVLPALGAGRLASVDGPLNNDTITYGYDELGRTTNRSVDGAANSTSTQFDSLGRVQSTSNLLGTFGYTYVNTTGRVDHLDYPNGQRAQYSYFDNLGDQRLKQIKNLDPAAAVISQFDYTYDAVGKIRTWTQANSGSSVPQRYDLAYDGGDQLRSGDLKNASTNALLKQAAYSYDPSGNRRVEQIDGSVQSASYNNLNQLTAKSAGGSMRFVGTVNEPASVTVGGSLATTDSSGNFAGSTNVSAGANSVPVVATDVNGNAKTNAYQVTVPNSAAQTLSYDANGNLAGDGTRTLEWDASDRLVAVNYPATGTRSEFTYDGLSRRSKIVEKSGSTVTSTKQFVWCGRQPCEERDGSNAVQKRFFDHGVQFGSTANFYARDHLASVRELTNSTGTVQTRYDYDLYGRRSKTTGTLDADFGFTGDYYHAPSNLQFAFYRAYDANFGRWLSRDLLRERGGTNLYAYVGGDPADLGDPLGLGSWKPVPGKPGWWFRHDPSAGGGDPAHTHYGTGKGRGSVDEYGGRVYPDGGQGAHGGSDPSEIVPDDVLDATPPNPHAPQPPQPSPSSCPPPDPESPEANFQLGWNPDPWLLGIGIAIGVGTVAEDFLTGGAGLLDDPLTLSISGALIKQGAGF